ncbi:hypothetical protein [Anianabacter salinae]|uniref:hypothetical protein n=1 Tax=Anianabacter salinae TaxID=2851023 RepID=UPI00225E2D6B|nr:hypothetical protein [Anianabacter salinae]MBV0912287.1 hypothetical protein [Anianabacter salinae]
MFDLRVRFFNPLWRRVLTVAVALGWAAVELASGNPGWAMLFGAAGAWSGYILLLTWVPVTEKDNDDD